MSGTSVSVRADAELVRISVRDGKLVMPVRSHTIYHNDPARGPATPGRPNEVAWLAFGLSPNQSVKIEAKTASRGKGHMARDAHGPILSGSNPVYSGKPKGSPSTWSYDVTLLDAGGNQLDTIDPDVHINGDP